MNISFLVDCPEHTKSIAHWYFDEWAKSYGVPLSAVINDVQRKSASKTAIPLIIVAEVSNQPVGVIELKFHENKEFNYEHWLGGLFVEAVHRRNGVAKALLTFAINHAAQLGVTKLYLQCKNAHQKVYILFGFTLLHSIENDTCVMVKFL